MKVLDRAMARELLGPFLFGLTLFILCVVSGEYLFKLTSLIARGADFLLVAELFGLRIITVTVISLPMAMLLTSRLVFGRLSSDSELVALQASGISILRIAATPVAFGLLLSVLSLVINEFVVPPAGRQSRKLEAMILTQIRNETGQGVGEGKAFVVQDFEGKRLSRVVIARDFDPVAGRMRDVIYLQLGAEGEVEAVVEAREAVWVAGNQWRFSVARITGMNETGDGRRLRMEGIPEASIWVLNKSPEEITRDLKKPEEMSYRELRQYIGSVKERQASSRAVRALEVGLHNKLSMPFTCLVFALLGTPLGIRRQRAGAAIGVGISIFLIFAYYIVWHSLAILGENGHVPTLFASWFANAVGLVTGLFLLLRLSR